MGASFRSTNSAPRLDRTNHNRAFSFARMDVIGDGSSIPKFSIPGTTVAGRSYDKKEGCMDINYTHV